jgi:hypothetical protein
VNVETRKNVLIVTDGAVSTARVAGEIAAVFTAASADSKVKIVTASDFVATDLLPADICFFGAEQPAPASFAGLEQLLLHINLAGRPGGLFAGSARAAAYLRRIVHDSELRVSSPPFVAGKSGTVKSWVGTIKLGL